MAEPRRLPTRSRYGGNRTALSPHSRRLSYHPRTATLQTASKTLPRSGNPDAAAPGQRRTEKTRGAPPAAPAPENGWQQPSAFKRRLRHRPTPRPVAGPGEVHGARTAGKDGAPACVGPDAPPGRAAFAAHPSGGDAVAGGGAANASPALGRAPGAGVGFRTRRRGGYATAGRAARGIPAARRERLAGLPPGRASGPAPWYGWSISGWRAGPAAIHRSLEFPIRSPQNSPDEQFFPSPPPPRRSGESSRNVPW